MQAQVDPAAAPASRSPTRFRAVPRRLAAASLALLAGYAALVWFASSAFIRVRGFTPRLDVDERGLSAITAATDDALTLRGSFIEPPDPRGVLVVFHGIGAHGSLPPVVTRARSGRRAPTQSQRPEPRGIEREPGAHQPLDGQRERHDPGRRARADPPFEGGIDVRVHALEHDAVEIANDVARVAHPGCEVHVVPGARHHDLWVVGGDGYTAVVRGFVESRLR